MDTNRTFKTNTLNNSDASGCDQRPRLGPVACVCVPICFEACCSLLQRVVVCCSDMNPRLGPVLCARQLIYACNRCAPRVHQEPLDAPKVSLCTESPVARGTHHKCVQNLFTAIGVAKCL